MKIYKFISKNERWIITASSVVRVWLRWHIYMVPSRIYHFYCCLVCVFLWTGLRKLEIQVVCFFLFLKVLKGSRWITCISTWSGIHFMVFIRRLDTLLILKGQVWIMIISRHCLTWRSNLCLSRYSYCHCRSDTMLLLSSKFVNNYSERKKPFIYMG